MDRDRFLSKSQIKKGGASRRLSLLRALLQIVKYSSNQNGDGKAIMGTSIGSEREIQLVAIATIKTYTLPRLNNNLKAAKSPFKSTQDQPQFKRGFVPFKSLHYEELEDIWCIPL